MKTILKTITFAVLMAFASTAFGLGTFQSLTSPGVAPVSANCVDKAEAAAILGRAAAANEYKMSDRGFVLSGEVAKVYAKMTNHPNPELVHEMVVVTFVSPGKITLAASIPFDSEGCNIDVNGTRKTEAEGEVVALTTPWKVVRAMLAKISQSES